MWSLVFCECDTCELKCEEVRDAPACPIHNAQMKEDHDSRSKAMAKAAEDELQKRQHSYYLSVKTWKCQVEGCEDRIVTPQWSS